MNESFSRREFLAASSVATAATLAPAMIAAAAPAAKDPYLGWPVGVQSYSFRKFNTYLAIRHMNGLGIHYSEFAFTHLSLDASPQRIDRVLRLLTDAKIKMVAHGVNRFSADHNANRKIFEFAERSGIRTLTASPSPDSFDSLERLVDEFDIRIAIHNHGPGSEYDSLADVKDPIQGKHKFIGACIDTGHFLRSKVDPVKAAHELGERVFALHVKDVAKMTPESHDVILGTGHLDLVDLFKAMRDVKFPRDGGISLEYESNPDNPFDDVKQSLLAVQEALAKVGRF